MPDGLNTTADGLSKCVCFWRNLKGQAIAATASLPVMKCRRRTSVFQIIRYDTVQLQLNNMPHTHTHTSWVVDNCTCFFTIHTDIQHFFCSLLWQRTSTQPVVWSTIKSVCVYLKCGQQKNCGSITCVTYLEPYHHNCNLWFVWRRWWYSTSVL